VEKAEFGLLDAELAQVVAAISSRNSVQSALIFGSRAKGNYRPGSDVDIGLIRILRTLGTPFFLTGGTALARAYLGHRALPSAPNVSSAFPCCAATFS
jgi:hypothetical protein